MSPHVPKIGYGIRRNGFILQGKEKGGSFSTPPPPTPHPCKFCDVSYNNRGGRERDRERKGVGGGRTRITYWLSVVYLTPITDRDTFGFPHTPP